MRGAVGNEAKAGAITTDLREVMNIRQASEYLGISPDTLYKYVSQGSIPAFKLGNRWRFKKTMLDRWMERQSQPREPGSYKTGSYKRGSSAQRTANGI